MMWAGSILDRLLFNAPEEYEDSLAETAMERILPHLGLSMTAMLNDNDPRPVALHPGQDHSSPQG